MVLAQPGGEFTVGDCAAVGHPADLIPHLPAECGPHRVEGQGEFLQIPPQIGLDLPPEIHEGLRCLPCFVIGPGLTEALHHDIMGAGGPQLQTALESWRKTISQAPPQLPAVIKEIGNLQISFRELQSEGQPNTMIFLNDVSLIRDSMQQAKLASLGHLTASIAHEIRNPLGAISYAAELLKEDHNFDEADQRMIEIITQHTSRINHIIEDILNISRGSETTRETIALHQWLPHFIDEFCQSGLATAESFKLKFESERTALLFDAGHLNQILTNLCTNACVHGSSNKPILIRVYIGPDYSLCVEIADQGPGVSSDILDQIFEPFYTTSHQGSGLGLYIVAQLCELNNASISASANQYNGTSFILRATNSASETGNTVNVNEYAA